MSVYIGDLRSAVFAFPVLALIIALPFLWWHYHKYRAISRWRVFWIYLFTFYLLCAYFLIILPLPDRAAVAKLTTPEYNLVPLEFIRQFMKYNPLQLTNVHTWKAALMAPTVIQPLFNVALTVPFGAFLRYYFHRPWWQVILGSFSLSLFFELTQLSGLYGYYPRPYRLFDVDDLLLNTTGGWLGCGLARLVMPILPTDEQMDRGALERANDVSMWRRMAGFIVDYLAASLIDFALSMVGALVPVLHILRANWVLWVVFVLWMAIPPMLGHRTLGMRVVRLRMARANGAPISWWQPLFRFAVGYGIPALTVWGMFRAVDAINGIGFSQFTWAGVGIIVALLLLSLMIGDWLLAFVMRSHRLLFEQITNTRLKSD